MKHHIFITIMKNIFLLLILSISSFGQIQYPLTKMTDSTDVYFGKTYKDPYRWLEKMHRKLS